MGAGEAPEDVITKFGILTDTWDLITLCTFQDENVRMQNLPWSRFGLLHWLCIWTLATTEAMGSECILVLLSTSLSVSDHETMSQEPWLNSIGCLYAIVLRTNCVPSCMEWYMSGTCLTWWCVCLNLPANLICAQRTRVLTTRREYAQRLVPDCFSLPPRMHRTNYLQTFARSPLLWFLKQHLKTHLFNIAYFY